MLSGRTAIIADWLPTFGGAEHVIAEFHALWPSAPLFTTVAKRGHLGPLDTANLQTSSLQKWYQLIGSHKVLLPLMPRAMEQIDLRGYDTVISSSHAVGKGIIPSSTARHICYCHTPMRYAWEMEQLYLEDFRIPRFLRKAVKKRLRDLRRWDLTTAKRVDAFIANSTATQERIKRIYNRESTVIHPPVRDEFFECARPEPQAFFLAAGRLVPYKRFDLLIQTANDLKIPLKIAGTGQDFRRLLRMSGQTVEMLGFVSSEELSHLYGSARALLFPQIEDAGVVPLEAQACGTPVIALSAGGALDTVAEGKTGVFFDEQSVDSLRGALKTFERMSFDPTVIRDHARQFSASRFRERIASFVESLAEGGRIMEGVR
jgi:glycosyltransferase involved in cell wall biosynthesis